MWKSKVLIPVLLASGLSWRKRLLSSTNGGLLESVVVLFGAGKTK